MKLSLDHNHLDPSLSQKIRTYHRWDEFEKTAKGKKAELGKQIKRALFDILPEKQPGSTYRVEHAGLGTELQLKSGRTKIEDGVLEQLLLEKGLLERCLRPQLDHNLVEQCFLEGLITDSDLRSIHGGADVSLALKVEKLDV